MIAARAALGLLAVSLCAAAPARAEVIDRVAATVGEEVIALSEVYEVGAGFIAEQCPNAAPDCVRGVEIEILDSLILRKLVQAELVQLQLDVTREDLDLTLDGIAEDNQLEGRAALRAEIERAGGVWDEYVEEMREQLRELRFRKWVIEPRIPVSEDELLDLYRRSARDLSGPTRVRFHAITVPVGEGGAEAAVAALAAVRARLESGELSWEQAVAEAHSGAITGAAGDSLPAVKQGDLAPALDAVVFGTASGAVSEPVVAVGYAFLVRPVERVEPDVRPFEEVRERLVEAVRAEKAELEIEQWYRQARRKATVRVLLETPAG